MSRFDKNSFDNVCRKNKLSKEIDSKLKEIALLLREFHEDRNIHSDDIAIIRVDEDYRLTEMVRSWLVKHSQKNPKLIKTNVDRSNIVRLYDNENPPALTCSESKDTQQFDTSSVIVMYKLEEFGLIDLTNRHFNIGFSYLDKERNKFIYATKKNKSL